MVEQKILMKQETAKAKQYLWFLNTWKHLLTYARKMKSKQIQLCFCLSYLF